MGKEYSADRLQAYGDAIQSLISKKNELVNMYVIIMA